MSSRTALSGPRGWGLVAALTAALVGTVALQVPASAGQSAPSTPVLGPPATAGAPAALADPASVRSAVARPSAGPAARPTAARPAAAPAAARPAAAPPSPASVRARPATAASTCSGPGWQQRRGAAALASLRPATSPARSLAFRAARGGFLGLTHMDSRRVEVFVRPCARQSDALLRHVVAHELGHAYDSAHLTPALRQAWMRARGFPVGTSWQGCDRCTDFATPAGDFAETYAQWRRGSADSRTRTARVPGPAALDRLAATFFRL